MFLFGNSLSQPLRGAKRHNLTTQIASQIDHWGSIHSTASQTILTRPRKTPGRNTDEEEAAARRASVKLQDGDVRGAVRTLCSEET